MSKSGTVLLPSKHCIFHPSNTAPFTAFVSKQGTFDRKKWRNKMLFCPHDSAYFDEILTQLKVG